MLSDGEEVNEVIKVSNLVAKFEHEIQKQTPNERFMQSVRQVLRDSRKVQKHPLQRQESEDRPDYIISTADCKPGPDHDLSACTDHQPRVKTRVLQHNRFTQLKEKCSEIINKNVRKSSKPPPPIHPRPKSSSNNTSHVDRTPRTLSLPNRRATNCTRRPKTIELKGVSNISEGYEIINYGDCLSEGDDIATTKRSLHLEPLDLSVGKKSRRHTSVESFDSGCDIDTPRATTLEKHEDGHFQQLPQHDQHHETSVLDTKVTTDLDEKGNHLSDDSPKGINIVCNIQVMSDPDRKSSVSEPTEPKSRRHSTGQVSWQDTSSNQSSDKRRPSSEPSLECHLTEVDEDSSSDEDASFPSFTEIFRLFEPNKTVDHDTSQYAAQLRTKLACKMAAEKMSKNNKIVPSMETVLEKSMSDVKPLKPSKVRPDCPVYHDPELEDFLSRCFQITYSVQDKLSRQPEDVLLDCFVPKNLVLPELLEFDMVSTTGSSLDTLSWSDGEAVVLSD